LEIRRRPAAALSVVTVAAFVLVAPFGPPVHAQSAPATKPTTTPKPTAKPATGTSAKTPAGKSSANAGRVDGIAAVVNDDVVLQSDVEEQLYLFLSRAQAQPDSSTLDTLRRQILDQLIDEKLIVAEAEHQGVTVPDAEIERQVDAAIADAKQRLGSPEAFQQQLARENLTEDKLRDKYREDVRRQLMAQRLVQKQIPPKKVDSTAAAVYFKANPDKFPKLPAELKLSVIQIPVVADSSVDAKAKAKIEAIRRRIVAGEKFAKVASEVSDDETSARAGGDLGYFTRGSMEPEFEDAAFSQTVGQLGKPVRSSYGWHLIEVIDRDTMKTITRRDSIGPDGKPVLEVHARHILVKVDLTDADAQRAQKTAQFVKSEIDKGKDFGTLAQKYSQYKGPHSADGDVGFVSLGTLAPNIRAGLDSLKVGQVSDILPNRTGFNIFKVTDRHPERAYTYEEIKEELPDAVSQILFKDKYDAYVKTLRSKAQIQIR
jgi:peptidyl-prolyl cis-trans isomerase SurA